MGGCGNCENQKKSIEDMVNGYGINVDSLISILQDIQSEYNYLSEESLREVAERLGLPLIQVYGVATFFKAFSLTPRGEHMVKVCLGTACHVRGAENILSELERQIGIKSGETSEDMQFTLETVNCLGACALGPVMVVDDKYHGQIKPGKIKKTLALYDPSQKENDNDETDTVSD